ncbi:hypothetical protein M3J09_000896 [Ascochyta lentis]
MHVPLRARFHQHCIGHVGVPAPSHFQSYIRNKPFPGMTPCSRAAAPTTQRSPCGASLPRPNPARAAALQLPESTPQYTESASPTRLTLYLGPLRPCISPGQVFFHCTVSSWSDPGPLA